MTNLRCLGSWRQCQDEQSTRRQSSHYFTIPLAARRISTPALPSRPSIITASSSGNNGSNNRLGPSNKQKFSLPTRSTSAAPIPSSSATDHQGLFASLCNSLDAFIGKSLYKYYNWRQDTLSDLQLFMLLNAGLISLGAVLKSQLAPSNSLPPSDLSIVDPSLDTTLPPPSWWQDLYSVLTVVLGQELPEEQGSNFPQQLFAVATAVLGVASFALVLALIEQATLELLENNVRRGSRVYEEDHYVILTYGESARDLSQCQTITEQICAASASSGGAVIVILVAHREKLEMETLFREMLPIEARCKSTIVFRQGSPLDPGALSMVSATDARAIILSGDYSRSVEDSDAQVLRCAVLLDEMTAAAGKEWLPNNNNRSSDTTYAFGTTGGMGPWVIAEVQGTNVPELLKYACSARVIVVPTTKICALRYARLLQHPAVATLSHALFDHKSRSNCHVGYFPEFSELLIGKKFSELHAYFPDAIVSGIVDIATWKSELSCPPDRILKQGEALVMLRQYSGSIRPLQHALPAALDPGSNWDPNSYSRISVDEAPLGQDATGAPVCVWNHNFNNNTNTTFGTRSDLNTTTTTATFDGPKAPPPRGPLDLDDLESTDDDEDDEEGNNSSNSLRRQNRRYNKIRSNSRLGAALLPLSYGSTPSSTSSSSGNASIGGSSAAVENKALGTDLLICGWPGSTAMLEVLNELDHGVEALPHGSRVILLNNHTWQEVSSQTALATTIQRLEISHVKCDPRDRNALSTALDVATLRAAVILHDTLWNGNFPAESSPIEKEGILPQYRAAAEMSAYSLSQSDMLRMDAAVLEVQLNVRYLLESSCCPDINILSEKLTYLGQTRFENRSELPIGAAINSASFAAKVIAQTAVQPRSLFAYARLGEQCEIVVQDAAAFAKQGEVINFFMLQARCASVSQVLLGYYDLPKSLDQVLNILVNPDPEDRMVKRVWNAGNSRCKLITLAPRIISAVPKSSQSQSPPLETKSVEAVSKIT